MPTKAAPAPSLATAHAEAEAARTAAERELPALRAERQRLALDALHDAAAAARLGAVEAAIADRERAIERANAAVAEAARRAEAEAQAAAEAARAKRLAALADLLDSPPLTDPVRQLQVWCSARGIPTTIGIDGRLQVIDPARLPAALRARLDTKNRIRLEV